MAVVLVSTKQFKIDKKMIPIVMETHRNNFALYLDCNSDVTSIDLEGQMLAALVHGAL
jgi:hypothetical protein